MSQKIFVTLKKMGVQISIGGGGGGIGKNSKINQQGEGDILHSRVHGNIYQWLENEISVHADWFSHDVKIVCEQDGFELQFKDNQAIGK